MLKKLLCPITGGAADRPALDTAAVVARHFAAHVEVLHAKTEASETVPYLGNGMSAGLIGQIVENAERRTDIRAAAARAMFDRWSRDRELAQATRPAEGDAATCSLRIETGAEDRWIARLGRLSDLVVLPAMGPDHGVAETLAFEAALFDSGRAVLLAPSRVLAIDGLALVAWNGSAEAARALAAALPLLAAASAVEVLTIEDSDRRADPEAVVHYLGRHGIRAAAHLLAAGDRSAAEEIDAQSASRGAGLLVMGGYTHSRLRELILGGVTAHVSRQPTVPVMLAH